MNKDKSNHKGKGTPRGQMPNQGNLGRGRNREGNDSNMNRGNETPRENPFADQNMNREKETHRMVSWNQEHSGRERGIHPVDHSNGSPPMSENEIQEIKSQAAKNTDTVDGYNAHQRNPMFNQESDYKFSTAESEGWETRLGEIKKAPLWGAVLYPIAVVFLVGWVIGFFIFDVGDTIHILLVLALISVLIKVAIGRSE